MLILQIVGCILFGAFLMWMIIDEGRRDVLFGILYVAFIGCAIIGICYGIIKLINVIIIAIIKSGGFIFSAIGTLTAFILIVAAIFFVIGRCLGYSDGLKVGKDKNNSKKPPTKIDTKRT